MERDQERIRLELAPLIKTREGFRYFSIIFLIKDDRPGICTEIVDHVRSSVKEANLKWILGNSLGASRAIIHMIFEVPEEKRELFKEVVDGVKKIKGVSKAVIEEQEYDLGIFAPRYSNIEFVAGNDRVVIMTTDFLDRLVSMVTHGGDPIITSLVSTVLYRTAYYRGFSLAEDLKRTAMLEGIELTEATLLQLRALGYFSSFNIKEEEDHIEIELRELAITPRVGIDNPLIIGSIAGIMDSSFGVEYEVKIAEHEKLGEGRYYAKVICKPMAQSFEEEGGRRTRQRRFLRR